MSLEEHKRRERVQAIGLFRYQLICPALEAGLSTKQRGRLVREIAQRTGMDEQELLKQLSAALPGVVDRLTPNGQVPSHHQVASAFNS